MIFTEGHDPSDNTIANTTNAKDSRGSIDDVPTWASIVDDEGDAGIIIIIKLNIEYFFLSPHLMAACGMASPVIYLY